jgi:hypothetical protein
MADIFYTILIAWVLWKIFGRTSVKTHIFHHHYSQGKKEGDIKVSKISDPQKKSSDNKGDYIDYEEVN